MDSAKKTMISPDHVLEGTGFVFGTASKNDGVKPIKRESTTLSTKSLDEGIKTCF